MAINTINVSVKKPIYVLKYKIAIKINKRAPRNSLKIIRLLNMKLLIKLFRDNMKKQRRTYE